MTQPGVFTPVFQEVKTLKGISHRPTLPDPGIGSLFQRDVAGTDVGVYRYQVNRFCHRFAALFPGPGPGTQDARRIKNIIAAWICCGFRYSLRVAGVTPVPAQREIVRNAVGLMLLSNSITETQARQFIAAGAV